MRAFARGACAVIGGWTLMTSACRTPSTPPVRPAVVPAGAKWAGGADGGAWILCTREESRNVNHCEIYFENGDLWTKGDYQMTRSGRAATPEELVYDGFDGDAILLASHQSLTPVAPRSETREGRTGKER